MLFQYMEERIQPISLGEDEFHRGMYQCSNGKQLNADINGTLNILKKSNKDF